VIIISTVITTITYRGHYVIITSIVTKNVVVITSIMVIASVVIIESIMITPKNIVVVTGIVSFTPKDQLKQNNVKTQETQHIKHQTKKTQINHQTLDMQSQNKHRTSKHYIICRYRLRPYAQGSRQPAQVNW